MLQEIASGVHMRGCNHKLTPPARKRRVSQNRTGGVSEGKAPLEKLKEGKSV
jgi:hypothetical protein